MKLEAYVLEALHPLTWQTAQEIRERVCTQAIAQQDWGPVSFLISVFSKKSAEWWFREFAYSSIYVVLDSLLESGDVEIRERRLPVAMLINRNGQKSFEYRLSQSRYRKREKRKEEVTGGELLAY